jgi:hypothetical protein
MTVGQAQAFFHPIKYLRENLSAKIARGTALRIAIGP